MSFNKGSGSSGNTSTTTSTTSPPPQFTAAYSNLTDRANTVSQQPLEQYTGPLVAGFTPQQQQGFQTIQNLQGSYAPYINAGAQEISQSTAPIWSGLPSFDTSGLPQGALDRINQSSDFATAAGTQPIAEKTDPYASFAGTTAQNLQGQVAPYTGIASDQAKNLPGQIAPMTGIATDQAKNLPGQVAGYTGQVSNIAGGLQGQAGSAANLANTAAASAPGNISTYQNPYTKNVTDALSNLFNQQNAEQLAQQRGSTVGAGAYGGDRQAVSEALLGKQQQLAEAPVLANVQQQGYQQAVQSALQDAQMRAQTGLGAGQLTTQAGLGAGQLGLGAAGATTQAAGTAGQLGLGAAGATTQAGLGAGQLGLGAGQLTSQTGLGAGQLGLGAGQLTGQSLAQQGQLGLGAGQLELGGGQQLFNEFNQQQGAQQQADTTNRWLNQGAGYGLSSLGAQAQNLGLAGAAANIGAGAQQQGLAQQQLNIPYEQFLQRQNYPYQQLNFLAPIVEGTGSQAGGTSSTSVPGPSTGSQLLGLGAAGAGILGATGGFGQNGYISNLFGPSSETIGQNTAAETIAGLDPLSQGLTYRRGGRVGLAAGGLPGMALPLETGVPDVSVDMVPALTGNARSPLVAQLAAPQTTTQTTGGSGGGGGGASSILGTIGTIGGAIFGGPTGAIIGGTAGRALGSLKEGGLAGGGEPAEASDSTAGLETQQPLATPNQQAGYERYATMDEEKLRQLTLQVPPSSQQGQLIRRALQQKQMGTQPPAQTPQNLPSTYLPLQSKGLEGYAKGGSADTVSEADMDPQPVVDHSGPTVRIHYPSEGGRILDLGIPSSPDRPGFALGGPPAGPLKVDPISHVSTTFKPGTPTNFDLPPVQSPPFFDFTKSPTGVSIPSIKPLGMFSPPGFNGLNTMDTGGGYGNWFAPQAQLIPSGTGFANAPPGGGPPPDTGKPNSPPSGGGGNTDPLIDPNAISYITPMYAAGGRTGLAGGGQGASQGQSAAGIDLGPTGVPHISLDYMMAPGPVIKGPGPPKPPPASQGAEPSGLDPAKILSNVKAFSGLAKGLSGKDDEGGLARGGRADGGLSDDSDDSAPIAKADLPPVEPRATAKLPPKEEPAPKADLPPQPRPNDVSAVQEAPTPQTVIPSKSTAEPSPPSAAPPTSAPVEAAKPSAPERKADTAKPPDTVQPSQIGAIPKLITEKAAAYGVPPAAATRFAQLESGMGQNLGTRGNVYQLGPNEWASMGGGDMRDTDTNIDRGVKYVAHDYEVARAKLGREPQEIEAYMVHQQGDAGGPALLAAPNASAVDVLTQVNGGNRQAAQQAIIQNQGDLSMTAGQFVALQKARLDGVNPNLSASQLVFHGGAPDPLVGRTAQSGVERTGYMAHPPSGGEPPPIPSPQHHEPGLAENPWLALAAAGFGTMAGRSPFALQNIGAGGLEGVKVLQEQAKLGVEAKKLDNAGDLAQSRAQMWSDRADETARRNDIMQRHYEQQLQLGRDNIDLKSQIAASTDATRQMRAESDRMRAEAAQANSRSLTIQRAIGADIPKNWYKPGTNEYGVTKWDPEKGFAIPDGAVLGTPPHISGFKEKQDAWLTQHPEDQEGALKFAGGHSQHQMSPEEMSRSAATLAQRDMIADPTVLAMKPEQKQARQDQIQQYYMNTIRGGGQASQPTTPAAPAASAPKFPEEAVKKLKAAPSDANKQYFDQVFGPGAAARALGG